MSAGTGSIIHHGNGTTGGAMQVTARSYLLFLLPLASLSDIPTTARGNATIGNDDPSLSAGRYVVCSVV